MQDTAPALPVRAPAATITLDGPAFRKLAAGVPPTDKPAALEARGHRRRDFTPKRVATFLMDRRVANHGKGLRDGRDKEEDAIALFCAGHAQLTKGLLRRRHRLSGGNQGDDDADFTRSQALGLRDGGLDGRMIQPLDEFGLFHATSSLPSHRRRSCRHHLKSPLRRRSRRHPRRINRRRRHGCRSNCSHSLKYSKSRRP